VLTNRDHNLIFVTRLCCKYLHSA